MQTACKLVGLGLVLAIGCAESGNSGDGGVPLGTLCYDLNGADAETCIDEATITAQRTSVSGSIWFQVRGELELTGWSRMAYREETFHEEVEVFGQVPIGWPLPREADHVFINIPIPGVCRETLQTNPFGGCTRLEHAAICHGQARYEAGFPSVTVEQLTDEAIELSVSGMLELMDYTDCCADQEGRCPGIEDPAEFDPAGPFLLAGAIHAEFPAE